MRDYIVKSSVIISFNSTIYVKGTDYFDAEARVEKIIRDVISNNILLNSLSNEGNVNVNIQSSVVDKND